MDVCVSTFFSLSFSFRLVLSSGTTENQQREKESGKQKIKFFYFNILPLNPLIIDIYIFLPLDSVQLKSTSPSSVVFCARSDLPLFLSSAKLELQV